MKRYTVLDHESKWAEVAPGVKRKLVHTENLMMVMVEFDNGPATIPDPFHSHPHEQVSYVAEGELILFIEGVGNQQLKKGEMFAIPSGLHHTIQTLTPVVRIIDCFNPIRKEFLQ